MLGGGECGDERAVAMRDDRLLGAGEAGLEGGLELREVVRAAHGVDLRARVGDVGGRAVALPDDDGRAGPRGDALRLVELAAQVFRFAGVRAGDHGDHPLGCDGVTNHHGGARRTGFQDGAAAGFDGLQCRGGDGRGVPRVDLLEGVVGVGEESVDSMERHVRA